MKGLRFYTALISAALIAASPTAAAGRDEPAQGAVESAAESAAAEEDGQSQSAAEGAAESAAAEEDVPAQNAVESAAESAAAEEDGHAQDAVEGAAREADDAVQIDITQADYGYITVTAATGAAARAELMAPDGQVTPFPLPADRAARLPLGGTGRYRITVFEQAPGGQFAAVASKSFEKNSGDELSAFLLPNVYVNYQDDSACAVKARELFDEAGGNRAALIKAVYAFVISSVAYDEDKAAELPSDYLPDPDETLTSGRGICLDYAALMAAMLRSCGVPCRLMIGNFDAYFHAWVSVTEEIPSDGRVRSAVWKTYDPTLGASNPAQAVQHCIDKKSNYTLKYVM